MRSLISDHSPMVLASVIAITLIVIGLLSVNGRQGSRNQPGFTAQLHFVNIETREIFTQGLAALPPITTASGHPAVIVHLYRCPHDSSAEPIIDHYEKYEADARRAFDPKRPDAARPFEGRLVSEDLITWYEARSPRGQEIITPPRCPDGSFAVRIRP